MVTLYFLSLGRFVFFFGSRINENVRQKLNLNSLLFGVFKKLKFSYNNIGKRTTPLLFYIRNPVLGWQSHVPDPHSDKKKDWVRTGSALSHCGSETWEICVCIAQLGYRICQYCGSGLDPDRNPNPYPGGQKLPTKKEKVNKFFFSAGCSLLRAAGFSFSLDVIKDA